MTHSFLYEAGYWNVSGYLLKPSLTPILVRGEINTSWKRENWFKITTSLTFDDETATQMICQCRGNLNHQEQCYTYIAQHNLLGNIEGEGRLGLNSIVQYYWFMGTETKHKGIDSFYRLDRNTYSFTSSILSGHGFKSIIEATLKR